MATSTEKYKLRVDPRISANQLAEYTLASPSRRHAIIRNAKFAPMFLMMRYGAARQAILDFLADGTRSKTTLVMAEAEQERLSKTAETEFKRNDAGLSKEAIQAFGKTQLPSKISRALFTKNTQTLPPVVIADVPVSVSLDAIARTPNGKVGGLLLQTSKAISAKGWRDEHSAMVASLVWMQASKSLKEIGDADRSLCFCVDIFAQSVKQAPASYKRRMKDMEISCTEIATFWPSITPPPDYQGPLP